MGIAEEYGDLAPETGVAIIGWVPAFGELALRANGEDGRDYLLAQNMEAEAPL